MTNMMMILIYGQKKEGNDDNTNVESNNIFNLLICNVLCLHLREDM